MTTSDARTVAAEYHGSAWDSLTDADQHREIARMSAAMGCRSPDPTRKALESAREALAFCRRSFSTGRDQMTAGNKALDAIAAIDAALASGEQDADTIVGMAASKICEVGALCGWPGPDCKSLEAAQALFDAGLLAATPPAEPRS